VQLAADVAQAYAGLRDAQRREVLLRRSGEIEQRMLDLTRQRRDLGTASQADVERLDTQLNQIEAAIAPLQAQAEASLDQLAVLTAAEPGQLDATLSGPGTLPLPPASVPIGDPAAMLRRRPDIRGAERLLAASNAQIGQAVAQFFPTVSLAGTVGFASTNASRLFTGASVADLGGAGLSWGIFNFGRTSARVREAEAGNEAALAQYQNTVLAALQDAETALSRFGRQREAVMRLAAAEASAARAAALTRERQQEGTASLIGSGSVSKIARNGFLKPPGFPLCLASSIVVIWRRRSGWRGLPNGSAKACCGRTSSQSSWSGLVGTVWSLASRYRSLAPWVA
jgi:outer membrane protein TolC